MASIELDVTLRDDFLAGGDHEQRPYLMLHGTWPAARFSVRVDGLAVGVTKTVRLPAPRPDDPLPHNLSMRLYAHTAYSGVSELDKSDRGVVWRQQASGTALLDLYSGPEHVLPIADHYVATSTYRTVLEQLLGGDRSKLADAATHLGEDAMHKVELLANNYAHKATLQVKLRSSLAERREGGDDTIARGQAAMAKFEREYWVTATDLPPPPDADVAARRFRCNPHEPLVENLYLLQWDTPHGRILPSAFVKRAPEPTDRVDVNFVEAHLLAAAARVGTSPSKFMAYVEAQGKSDTPLAYYTTAVELLESYATFTSNAIHYTADRRYPNVAFFKQQDPEVQRLLAPQLFKIGGRSLATPATLSVVGGSLQSVPSTFRAWLTSSPLAHQLKCSAKIAAHRPADFADGGGATAAAPLPPLPLEERLAIQVESWDRAAYGGECNDGDCEDSGFGAAGPLATLQRCAPLAKDRPFVAAATHFLSNFVFVGTGSTVTEPFLKGDGHAKTAVTHLRLPLIGSTQDAQWSENGHAYLWLMARAVYYEMVARGLDVLPLGETDHARVRKLVADALAATPKWSRRVPSIIGEGTAPGVRWALPYEEVVRGDATLMGKAAAKMAFARRCRLKASEAHAALAKYCRLQSQPYELWAERDATRRTSPFYRTVCHLVDPEPVTPLLGQTMAVSVSARTRGVAIADFLRGSSDVALVAPAGRAMTEAEWARDYQPYEDLIVRHQPRSSWALHEPPPAATVGACYRGLGALAGDAAEPNVDSADMAAIERAAEGTTHAVLPLSLPLVKLTRPARAELTTALETLKQRGDLTTYVWSRTLPMKHLPEQAELLLLLPVPATIDESMFPHYRD